MTESFITALGTANPIYKRSQIDAARFIADIIGLKDKKRKQVETLFINSGVAARYSVLADYTKQLGEFTFFPNSDNFIPFPSTAQRMHVYQKEALALAVKAVTNCINSVKGLSVTKITHLITVSCTGMYNPGLDIELVQQLKLSQHTQRIAINFMGCYGAFNGLKAADAICKADTNACVLLVCVELCSLHLQQNKSLDNIISSALFSDGAAAAIIQATANHIPALALENFHCDIVPNSSTDMAWYIGNTGFEMALSAYVPRIIRSGIAEFTHNLLAKNQHTLADIDLFAIHPGGKRILEACEKALAITKEDNRYAYAILKDYGNMSSATILFVFDALLRDVDKSKHGKKILSLAFGPGLTLESMLLRLQIN